MKQTRAVIYCRISQDRDGTGLGVQRQESDCRKLCDRNGWVIARVLVDNDVSAASGRRRSGYEELLDLIRSGQVDAVVVWALDRLYRRPIELEQLIPLTEARGVRLATIGGEHDLGTRGGLLHARIMGAVAADESRAKSDRIKAAQAQAAAAGKWLGGPRPFGWDVREGGTAVLNRNEARVVRKSAEQLLAGASLGSIVDGLNARSVTTSTGRPWNYTSLRQVLTRPRNAGLSTIGGETVGVSSWPPLLSEDTWRAVCSLFADPDRRRSTSNRLRWMLAGLALCPCGSTVRSATVASNRAAGTTRTVYRCRERGPGHVARSAGPVDDFIGGLVVARLARADARDLLTDEERPDVEALRSEAVALRARIGEAGDMYADGEITRVQLERVTSRVQKRLDDVEGQMAATARGSVLAELVGARDPARVWTDMTVERRRAVVSVLMRVTLKPSGKRGNVFDPELVGIKWTTS